MNKGWISLHRKVMDCWVYDCRPFDEFHAFCDLLLLARHRNTKKYVNGELVEISQGQLLMSIRKIAERWGWSKDKTAKFLKILESDKMITRSHDKNRTVLTIVNYGVYQNLDEDNQDTNQDTGQDAPKDAPQDTMQDTDQDNNNNDNNGNNDNNENNDNNIYNNKLDSNESNRPSEKPDGIYPEITEAWNSLSVYGITPIRKIAEGTSKRCKSVRARVREYGVEGFMQCIENIKNSEFLLHKMNGGSGITFDWMILPSNFPKVLEGNYSDTEKQASNEWRGLV